MHLTMLGVSDNKGNESLIHKNLTSKYPLYVVLLELTEQLQIRNMSVNLKWQKRECNKAADALTNYDFSSFNASLRIQTPLSEFKWLVLPKLLESAQALHLEISSRKAAAPKIAKTIGQGGRKKRKHAGLRVTDPW